MKKKKLQKLSLNASPSGQESRTAAQSQAMLRQRIRSASQMIAGNRHVLYGSFLIMLIATIYYYPHIKVDYDIWYHLKFGEHFVTNKTFQLDHSIFSWTPADPEWKYGIWLGSSFLYLLHSFGGVYALEFFKWLVIISVVCLYFYYCRTSEGSIDINNILLAFLLLIVMNSIASMVKPDNFTLLFFAVIVLIYFFTKLYSKRLFYVYPLIFLVWVNTHGGFLIGLFFITLALFGEVTNLYLRKKGAFSKRLVLEFAIAVFFSYVVTLINPYGISYHIYIIPTYFKSEVMGYAGRVFAFESLWEYAFSDFFRLRNTLWGLILLFAVFVGLTAFVFGKKRQIDPGLLLLNLVFLYIGTGTSRVAAFSAIVAVFSISYLLRKGDALYIKSSVAAISAIIFVLAAAGVSYDSLTKNDYRAWIVTDDVTPEQEVAYIKKYKLPQPIFNDYLTGGYLIWAMYPEYKVFIDPRYGPYWKEVGPDYFDLLAKPTETRLKALNQKYPFKTAIIHYSQSAFIKLFMRSDDWKLIYFGNACAVFIRKDVLNEISKDALSVDISAQRFYRLADPITLNVLFTIYANLGLAKHAEDIIAIYDKNISPFYAYKNTDIIEMRKFLRTMWFNIYKQNSLGVVK